MRKIMKKIFIVFLNIWIIFCWAPKLEVRADHAIKQHPYFTNFADNLETVRQTLKIPGMSVAVIENQEIIFAKGFGYADLEDQVPATPDTPYGLASVTKPIAAVLIMQLVEEGLVDLDTPIADYGVNLLGDEITVRHLLTHTSEGIPGTKHNYNGSRYGMLSGVIENVTGKTFAENLSERFLLPLEMQSTALNPINFWGGSNSTGLRDLQPALGWGTDFRHYPDVYAQAAKPYQFDENYHLIPGMYQLYHNAAAGMISTVNDLAKFDIALDQGVLLHENTKVEMHAPMVSTYENRTDLMYGLGWYVQEFGDLQLLWHTGRWPPSTSALYLKVPAENLTFIVLANTDNLTTPFYGIGQGDISKSLLALTFFRYFIFPENLGAEIPTIDWHATEGPIINQLSTVEDLELKAFLERELWAYRQAYASVGQKGAVNKLWRVNQRAFPDSTLRYDEFFTQTVGQAPVIPESLSITAFARLSWGILVWFALVVLSIVSMLIILVRSAETPKFQWLYWLLSASFLGPVSILVYRITRPTRDVAPPPKWQSALIGSAFVVSVYALGWTLAFTLLPYFGTNPGPLAILGTTYLIPLLISWTFLRIPCIFSWGRDQPVKLLLCSLGAELISMNIAYAVLFPLTMILNQLLTTIPGSFNPFYWAMLSLISGINLLAQFPIHYWMMRRGISTLRFRNTMEPGSTVIFTFKNAFPVFVISCIIVIGALALTIRQMS
jgi:CubicO group peptidase (beta-lactamase class C family)